MIEDISRLLEESRNLLAPVGSPKFCARRSTLYEIMTSNEHRIFPAVHLWEPTRELLESVVTHWEPGLTAESYYIAVHGHSSDVMCGGKSKWTQLCHMAYFKPWGVEKEAFNIKWKELYSNAGSEVSNPSPEIRNRDSSNNSFGEGGVGLRGMEFTF